jgi:outer membrane protein, heavy metal efflux system
MPRRVRVAGTEVSPPSARRDGGPEGPEVIVMSEPVRFRACLAVALAVLGAAPAARALDLETALRDVLAANPMLGARTAMTEAAHARIAPSGAWNPPMLEAGVQNVPAGGNLYQDEMTMRMVGLSQRVPIFGANGLARRAATEDWQAERWAEQGDRLEMLAMTWERYADAYWAGELARLGADHRAVMDRMVEAAEARYRAGRGRLDDVLRAQADRARMLADLQAFGAEARGARARLDALRGRDPGADADADALAAPPDALAPEGSPAWAAALDGSQPRLAALERRAAGRRASAQAMRRMSWPDLELRGSWAKRGPMADGMELDDMWSASVGVMLPVFAGSRERSQAAEMDAMARAADGERRAAALDLAADLAEARARAVAAQRTAALLADTVVTAQQRALDASWIGYEAGTTDLARVLESAHALYGEHVALVRARQEFARACARVLAITGKGELVGVNLPALEEGSAK